MEQCLIREVQDEDGHDWQFDTLKLLATCVRDEEGAQRVWNALLDAARQRCRRPSLSSKRSSDENKSRAENAVLAIHSLFGAYSNWIAENTNHQPLSYSLPDLCEAAGVSVESIRAKLGEQKFQRRSSSSSSRKKRPWTHHHRIATTPQVSKRLKSEASEEQRVRKAKERAAAPLAIAEEEGKVEVREPETDKGIKATKERAEEEEKVEVIKMKEPETDKAIKATKERAAGAVIAEVKEKEKSLGATKKAVSLESKEIVKGAKERAAALPLAEEREQKERPADSRFSCRKAVERGSVASMAEAPPAKRPKLSLDDKVALAREKSFAALAIPEEQEEAAKAKRRLGVKSSGDAETLVPKPAKRSKTSGERLSQAKEAKEETAVKRASMCSVTTTATMVAAPTSSEKCASRNGKMAARLSEKGGWETSGKAPTSKKKIRCEETDNKSPSSSHKVSPLSTTTVKGHERGSGPMDADKKKSGQVSVPPRMPHACISARKASSSLSPKSKKANTAPTGSPNAVKKRSRGDIFFSFIWKALMRLGWTYDQGHRKTDHYFMPPGVKRGRGFAHRVDYFDSFLQVMTVVETVPKWRDHAQVREAYAKYVECSALKQQVMECKNKVQKEQLKQALKQKMGALWEPRPLTPGVRRVKVNAAKLAAAKKKAAQVAVAAAVAVAQKKAAIVAAAQKNSAAAQKSEAVVAAAQKDKPSSKSLSKETNRLAKGAGFKVVPTEASAPTNKVSKMAAAAAAAGKKDDKAKGVSTFEETNRLSQGANFKVAPTETPAPTSKVSKSASTAASRRVAPSHTTLAVQMTARRHDKASKGASTGTAAAKHAKEGDKASNGVSTASAKMAPSSAPTKEPHNPPRSATPKVVPSQITTAPKQDNKASKGAAADSAKVTLSKEGTVAGKEEDKVSKGTPTPTSNTAPSKETTPPTIGNGCSTAVAWTPIVPRPPASKELEGIDASAKWNEADKATMMAPKPAERGAFAPVPTPVAAAVANVAMVSSPAPLPTTLPGAQQVVGDMAPEDKGMSQRSFAPQISTLEQRLRRH